MNVKKIVTYSFLIIFSLTLNSCYYDNEEALYPVINNNCDTTNVTFSGTTKTILSTYCLTCHSNQNAAGLGNGVRLEDYIDVATNAISAYNAMSHSPAARVPMPPGGAKIDDCSILQFNIWMNKGKPNN